MAYIEPNSDLHIFKGIPFDPTYNNTMYFVSASEQYNWFMSKAKISLDKLSYVRKSRGVIRVELTMAQLYDASYLMYRNTSFENKWFYAFIDKLEYVNNITTDIYFTIDVIQTWLPEFTNGHELYEDCLILREHTTSDAFGEHIVDEGLDCGEIVSDGPVSGGGATFPERIVVCTTMDYSVTPPQARAIELYPGRASSGGVFGGGSYLSGAQFNVFTTDSAGLLQLQSLLNAIAIGNDLNGFITMFMSPALGYEEVNGVIQNETTVSSSLNSAIGNYTPRNKKLLTYPYNFLYVLSSSGDSHSFRYELFSDPAQIRFCVFANSSTRPSMILFAKNYKGGDCFDETVTIDNLPLCSWSYDTFKAWLAQNAGSLASGIITAFSFDISKANPGTALSTFSQGGNYPLSMKETAERGLGISIGGVASVDVGKLLQIGGKMFDVATKAPTIMGNGNGDLNYQCFGIQYFLERKHIRPQIAQIIDNYFDMYGYKTLRIGKPNLAARPCYTYTKTANCSIQGALPADDKKKIEEIFNNGVRFWKPTAVFGSFDPTVNNNVPV